MFKSKVVYIIVFFKLANIIIFFGARSNCVEELIKKDD